MFKGVKVIERDKDIQTIMDNYWSTFNTLFDVTEEEFIKWIEEDTYGGWEDVKHPHAGGRRELIMLYVTIRATKPKNILEIGTYDGCSTDHILLAAENNTKEGYECNVTTVDINDYVKNRKLHDWKLNRLIEPSLDHMSNNNQYDFIMQDGNHQSNYVTKELDIFSTLPNLKTVWSHDYYLHNSSIKETFNKYLNTNSFFSKRGEFKEDAYKAGFHIGII